MKTFFEKREPHEVARLMRRITAAYSPACRYDAQHVPAKGEHFLASTLHECRNAIDALNDECEAFAEAERGEFSHQLRSASHLIDSLIRERDAQCRRADAAEADARGLEVRLARAIVALENCGYDRAAIDIWMNEVRQ